MASLLARCFARGGNHGGVGVRELARLSPFAFPSLETETHLLAPPFDAKRGVVGAPRPVDEIMLLKIDHP